ncbi:PaaI family thioesterase [Sphingomonas adhaesiva]|uniref:PaaI family thioesterase n=1 Tax=Sphingomonas adhaesiva TaxID=28212 RepID=UPI002FF586C5
MPKSALPLLTDRFARVPMAGAIGMRVVEGEGDGAAVHAILPATAAVMRAGEETIDPLALLPFIDQLASAPLMAEGGEATTMATIDLAIGFAALPGAGDLTGVARAVGPAGGAARLVQAEVRDAAGVTVATGSAWFSMGQPPGGSGTAEHVERAVVATGPFQTMIGLAGAGEDEATLAPQVWAAIGWTGLPALHGGAVAAALARAGQQRIATLGRDDLRLASIAIRYLRAARDTGARATATVDAIGRRTARLSATLAIAGEPVASAQLLFVA